MKIKTLEIPYFSQFPNFQLKVTSLAILGPNFQISIQKNNWKLQLIFEWEQ